MGSRRGRHAIARRWDSHASPLVAERPAVVRTRQASIFDGADRQWRFSVRAAICRGEHRTRRRAPQHDVATEQRDGFGLDCHLDGARDWVP